MGVRRRLMKELLKPLKYIKNLSEQQISASLWRGETTLYNVELDPAPLQQAFHDVWPCGLEITQASVKELCIRIPWNRLMTQSVLVIADTIEVVVVAHVDDEVDWHDLINGLQLRLLRSLHKKIESAPATMAAGAFEQMRQRMTDGLQVQINKVSMTILSNHPRHLPFHDVEDEAPQEPVEVLRVTGEDVFLSPADASQVPTDKLKDMATYFEKERTLALTKILKIRAFTVSPGRHPCKCPHAVSVFMEDPAVVTCNIVQKYPSDGSRMCPLIIENEMLFDSIGTVTIKCCECQLKAFTALGMDVVMLEQWRTAPELLEMDAAEVSLEAMPEPEELVLQDCSSVTRTFARGPGGSSDSLGSAKSKTKTGRSVWSALWRKPSAGDQLESSDQSLTLPTLQESVENDELQVSELDIALGSLDDDYGAAVEGAPDAEATEPASAEPHEPSAKGPSADAHNFSSFISVGAKEPSADARNMSSFVSVGELGFEEASDKDAGAEGPASAGASEARSRNLLSFCSEGDRGRSSSALSEQFADAEGEVGSEKGASDAGSEEADDFLSGDDDEDMMSAASFQDDYYSVADADDVGSGLDAGPKSGRWFKPVLKWLATKGPDMLPQIAENDWPDMHAKKLRMGISLAQTVVHVTVVEPKPTKAEDEEGDAQEAEIEPQVVEVRIDDLSWASENHIGLTPVNLECVQRLANFAEGAAAGAVYGPPAAARFQLPEGALYGQQRMTWPRAELRVRRPGEEVVLAQSLHAEKRAGREAMCQFSWQPKDSPPMIAESKHGVIHTWPICVKVRGAQGLLDLDALNMLKEFQLRVKPYLASKYPPVTMRPPEEPFHSDQLYPSECIFLEFLDCECQEVHCERIRLGEKRFSFNGRIPHIVLRSSSDLWDFGNMLLQHDIEPTDTHGVRERFLSMEADGAEAEAEAQAAVTLPKQMFDDLVKRASEATLKESQVSAAREELQKSYITIASLRATATAKEQAQYKQQLQQQQASSDASREDGGGRAAGLWRAISRDTKPAAPASLTSAAAGSEDKAGTSTGAGGGSAVLSRQASGDTAVSAGAAETTPTRLSLGIGALGGMWKGRGPQQSSVEVDMGLSPTKLKEHSPNSSLTGTPLLAEAGILSEPDVTASPPLQPQPPPVLTEAEELEKLRQKYAQLEKSFQSQALAQRRLETEFVHYQLQAREELRHALATKSYSGASPAPGTRPWIPPAEPPTTSANAPLQRLQS